MALAKLGRPAEAVTSFERAIALHPDHWRAYNHRGNALVELGHIEAARASYAAAVALRFDYAEAHNNLGLALLELGQPEKALASFDIAIALQPAYADAHTNRGSALHALGEIEAALTSYDVAAELRPDLAGVHFNRAQLLEELRQFIAAVKGYDHALAIRPDLPYVRGHRLLARLQTCDWLNLEAELDDLAARIDCGEPAATPFAMLGLSDSPSLQRKTAEQWVRRTARPAQSPSPRTPRSTRHRMRVGYFSADFCNHPVSGLMAGVFESHDRSMFEVYAFSLGPDIRDAMRLRLEQSFDRFIDVRTESASQIAALARDLEIDIAVDLTGFTKNGRPAIFALRAAPLQVSYIGFLGTMGAPYIDYLIADSTIVPPPLRGNYSESLVYLPNYQANDPKRTSAARHPTREEHGLPASGFVFCCFNANYKIMPAMFDCWVRLLKRVPGSVLWLYAGTEAAVQNLRREAAYRGIDADRLVFGARLPGPEYLSRYAAADLFLDTLPYNAGATASDALWEGLPVLTCSGQTFAGRIATSLLVSLDLPELVTSTLADYEERAIELATDAGRMILLRERLAERRGAAALFDARRQTRALESAYLRMQERRLGGLPPADLHIDGP